ncbi:MAG: methylmalonyl Co-A mutase-associated GTPase MeaB, partial [Bacteroidales bacterium]|nr:methylmalonyl Co-A mutase-associated GTPase MeaB [Bacteroidales bacterium]
TAVTSSAVTKEGLPEILKKIEDYFALGKGNGLYRKKRREQARYWMYESINESLKNMFYEDERIERLIPEYEDAVLRGDLESFSAATELIEKYQKKL